MSGRDQVMRDAHVRLCVAAKKRRGVRLSAEDVASLVRRDDAIYRAALSFLEERGYTINFHTLEITRDGR